MNALCRTAATDMPATSPNLTRHNFAPAARSDRPFRDARTTLRPLIRAGAVAVAALVCLLEPRAMGGVFISEFLADNAAGLRTAAGQYSDWVELANDSDAVVDVGDWYLTDNAAKLAKWRIPPGTTIPANGYLIIFADSSSVALP